MFSLDRNLEHAGIIRQIGEQYTKFCDSPEAKKLSIKSRKITEGAQLRLLFETLCFTTFLTFEIVPKHVSTRKLLRKKTNPQLVNYYINRVARHLFKLCQDLGMTKLRDIVLISTPPETKIKFGDLLNPVVRLKEYKDCRARKRDTETERFGAHIGRALDPYHYQELAILTRPQVSTLSKLVEDVMAEIFKPTVKLKA